MLIRFGVILIAWLAIISGIIGALVGGFAALAGGVLDINAPANQFSAEGVGGLALILIGLTFAIIGIAQVILGVGLWQMRGWAWTLGVLLESITLLGAIGGIFTGALTAGSLITAVISGAILFYLLSPRVRKLFGRRSRAQVA
ncbi:MAG: hypothetical protein KGO05_03135 [Chloroflexota bacterium]|nr:hypothetical protein [Chloroflexota bacterium]